MSDPVVIRDAKASTRRDLASLFPATHKLASGPFKGRSVRIKALLVEMTGGPHRGLMLELVADGVDPDRFLAIPAATRADMEWVVMTLAVRRNALAPIQAGATKRSSRPQPWSKKNGPRTSRRPPRAVRRPRAE